MKTRSVSFLLLHHQALNYSDREVPKLTALSWVRVYSPCMPIVVRYGGGGGGGGRLEIWVVPRYFRDGFVRKRHTMRDAIAQTV